MKRITGLLLILCAITASAQTITRKAVLREGQQFERTVVNKTEMTMSVNGQERELTNQITGYKLITIDEVQDTAYSITNMLTRMVYEVNSMGTIQHLDSDSAEDVASPFGEGLFKEVGKAKKTLIDKWGDIIFSEDTIAVTEEIVAATGSLTETANALKRPGRCYELIGPLPKRRLKAGDEWTDTFSTAAGKEIETYKVTSISRKEVIISHTGKVSTVTEMNSGAIKITTEGIATGNFSLDPKTGIATSVIHTTQGTGTMEMRGQSIPIAIKVVQTITLKERKH